MSKQQTLAEAIAEAQNVPFVGPKQRRIEAAVATWLRERLANPETEEFVVRWLYNGIDGHQAEPPPAQARENLEPDAANVLAAVTALLLDGAVLTGRGA